MATYESLIKIKGTVRDLVFYELNGKNVVRKKSGFNKTAFKKSPTYEKVRQNSSEFGHCSKVGKMIRQALVPYIKIAGDPLLYQTFAKIMTEIKDLDDVSERGKRTVKNGLSTEKGKEILKNFQFGKYSHVGNEAFISSDLWEVKLNLNKQIQADEVSLVMLKIDFENYLTESFEEKRIWNKEEISFQKHYSDDDFVLYFIALYNEGKIVRMGFL
ncbi:hypothetical protein [Chryseobacterium wanjuense]